MGMILKLTRIFFKEMFSNGDFFENVKTGKKKLGKIIAYTLLIIYIVVVFGFMYISTISTIHTSFAPLGLGNLTPTIIAMFGFLITFIFGFMVTISTYVTSANEEVMLAMPIKNKELFTAKYLCCYLNELLLGSAVILVGLGIYGYFEKLLTNPLFYLEAIISSLVIPMLSVGICYLILVVLLGCFKFLRKKNILMTISTTIICAFFLIFYFSFQNSLNSMMDPELFMATGQLASFENIGNIASFFPPIKWFTNAIVFCGSGEILKSIGWLLLLVTICVSIPAILLPVLSPLYIRSLDGFNEAKVKKLEKGKEKEFIKSDIKSTPVLTALLKRDIVGVLREASWFANGPLTLIIFPVIFGISFFAGFSQSNTNISELLLEANKFVTILKINDPELLSKILFWVCLGGGAIACAMGTMTSVSSTSISREGKGLQNILALPFPVKKLVSAKMLHAMLYSVISSMLIFVLLVMFAVLAKISLSFGDYLLVFVNFWWSSLILAFIIHLVDMLIDVCHPKLTWENPTAVFKQNLMTVAAMFLSWGILGLTIIAAIFLLPQSSISLLIINIAITIVAIPLWFWFQKFATKKLSNLY